MISLFCFLESKKEVRDLIEFLQSQISLLNVHMAVEKLKKISNRFDPDPIQVCRMEIVVKIHTALAVVMYWGICPLFLFFF